MRPFILLLKIQLLGLFGINKALHADAAKAKRTLALGVLAVVAVVAVVAVYSVSVAQGLVRLGLVEAVPFAAVLVGALAGAVAAFLKTNGVLFAFKDYDLVMSLPVPTSIVVLSRISSLYAMSLALSLLVMVPAFGVYAANVGVGALAVAFMALSIVLAPLLPLAVAVVLAALIAAFSSRFRHANIAMAALSAIVVVTIVVGSFALSGQSGDMAALGALGAEAMSQVVAVYPPAAWAAGGIVYGDALSFAAFAAASLAAGVVLVVVLVRLFALVNGLLMSSRPQGAFSFEGSRALQGARSRSPFRALLVKEARLVLATPIYLLNACMGYVLVLVASVAALVASFAGVPALDALQLGGVPDGAMLEIVGFLPWAVAFCFGISSTTAPSVSLEGSSRWLMLTAPVPTRTVLGAKAALNLMMALPTVAIAAVAFSVAFAPDALTMAALVIVPAALALFATFFGLYLDACRPRYDWTTVYEPVKRGLPVFGVVIGGMAFVGLGMAANAVAGTAASIGVALIIGVASVALFRVTMKRGISA